MKYNLIIIILLQVIFLGTLIINLFNPTLIFLRQFIGFLYLTFIPGILLLRIFLKNEINSLTFSEFIVYSVGLSLSFLMFIGFLINLFLLLFFNKFTNIKLIKPFSETILITVIGVITFALWLLSYLKQWKIHYELPKLEVSVLCLGLLILLSSISSTYFIDYYNKNILALIVIVAISAILIAVAFDKISPENFPFMIWIISLSLLYLNSLLGNYIKATDNITEFYYSNLVIKNGFWDHTIPAKINAMLGVVMILPIYSIVCSINLIWIYKVIVPLLFSLVPVGLYEVFRRITNQKISFLSVFFFVSMYEFYTWFGLTMKMVTAGFFLMLLILFLTDRKLNEFSKSILSIIFAFSLSVSHYGTSYIFMFCLLGAFVTHKIIKKKIKIIEDNKNVMMLTPTFIASYIVFTVSWYIYNSSSAPYVSLVNLGKHIVESISEEYILPERSYGYQIIKGGCLPLYLQVLKALYVITTIFITIGLLNVIFKRKFKFNSEYISFSIPFFLSGGSVFVGGLSGACTPDRLYQIISFFLAPYCVIGGITVIDYFKKVLKIRRTDTNSCIKILSIFFIIFLLFNTCFVAEVVWRYNIGPMVSVSKPRIIHNGSLEEKEYFNRVYMLATDVKGAEWLHSFMNDNRYVYCDKNSWKIFVIVDIANFTWEKGLIKSNVYTLTNKTIISKSSYIYLSKFNTETSKVKIRGGAFPVFINLTQIPKINISNKIYTNGGCEIYFYL